MLIRPDVEVNQKLIKIPTILNTIQNSKNQMQQNKLKSLCSGGDSRPIKLISDFNRFVWSVQTYNFFCDLNEKYSVLVYLKSKKYTFK
jgi:hypothetical protein